jgi:chromosome segregation ATPase
MMNNVIASPSELESAVSLLSILEMAKDATKLKEALKKIKDAQAAAAEKAREAQAAQEESDRKIAALADRVAEVAERERKASAEALRVKSNAEFVEAEAAAIKAERARFDAWMAAEREALAALQAKVQSDAFSNERRASELADLEEAARQRMKDADVAIRTADARAQEYEAKVASLRAMVS